MTKIQISKKFEYWNLGFGIYLLFGYCNLVLYIFMFGENIKFLNQLTLLKSIS